MFILVSVRVNCVYLYSNGVESLLGYFYLKLGFIHRPWCVTYFYNSIVLYCYKQSLVSLTIWSSFAYILTNSGNRLTAISTAMDLGTPISLLNQVRFSLKVESVLMVNILSFIIPPMYIHYYAKCIDKFVYTLVMSLHHRCIYVFVYTLVFALYIHNISTIWALSTPKGQKSGYGDLRVYYNIVIYYTILVMEVTKR